MSNSVCGSEPDSCYFYRPYDAEEWYASVYERNTYRYMPYSLDIFSQKVVFNYHFCVKLSVRF